MATYHAFALFTKRTTIASALVFASAQALALEPYQATYTAKFDVGVSINGQLKRTLSQNSDKSWVLEDKVKASLGSIAEKSHFRVIGGEFKTVEYNYFEKKVFKKYRNTLSFDWNSTQASNSKGNVFAITAKTLDPLNYQLRLQQDLAKGLKGPFSYEIAKKDKLDTMKFVLLGNEQIDTTQGPINTLKLQRDRGQGASRVTYIWLDPNRQFVITKLEQTEPDGKSYSLVLKDYK